MVTKAEWTERVKRWGKSGLGREEFAEGEGINAKRLTWWRWTLEPVYALEGAERVSGSTVIWACACSFSRRTEHLGSGSL